MKNKHTENILQRTVKTPLWLQRRMRRNLVNAAHNKVSPLRARCAKELLAKLGESESSHSTATPATKPEVVTIDESESVPVKQQPVSSIKKSMKATVTKCLGKLINFKALKAKSRTAAVSTLKTLRHPKHRIAN